MEGIRRKHCRLPAPVLHLLVWLLPFSQAVSAVAPYVHTQPVTLVTSNRAALNGMVVPNGLETTTWFEWGPRGAYNQTTAPIPAGDGTTVVSLSAPISGLTNGGIYQFRLVASNQTGIAYGAPRLFTTGKRLAAWGENDLGQTTVPPGLTDVVAVACGTDHNLIIRNDGRVAAWGWNSYGGATVPVDLTNAVAVAGGSGHSLALRPDSTVRAWGYNAYGIANVPPSLSNVIAIASGSVHALALKSDGTVVAWGNNFTDQTNVPPDLTNVVALASASQASLALKADGTVVGWGYLGWGVPAVPPDLSNVVAIACGQFHGLALKNDRTVVTWGNLFTNMPAGLSNVVAIACGYYHSLALLEDGSLIGWGQTSYGHLDFPAGLTDIAGLAAGSDHSLALCANLPPVARDQTVLGFPNRDLVISLSGSDVNGDALRFRITSLPAKGSLFQYAGLRGAQIVDPDTLVTDSYGRVIYAPATNEFASPYASFQFAANDGELDSLSSATLTIQISGSAYAFTHPPGPVTLSDAQLRGMGTPNGLETAAWFEWGTNNTFGQLTSLANIGSGFSVVPVQAVLAGLAPLTQYRCRLVVSNAAGVVRGPEQRFSTGRRLQAWGRNTSGQITLPAGLTNAISLAAGRSHSLALRPNNTVAAWGNSDYGQTNVPAGLTDVVGLAAGSAHSVALRKDGTLRTWGQNGFGQTSVPAGAIGIVAIACGDNHNLALKSNGNVIAWGDNYYGQTSVPSGLSNVVAVAACSSHNLALKADGTVVEWGSPRSYFPVPPDATNVVAIAAGRAHLLALKTDGKVIAWGDSQSSVPFNLSNVVAIAAGDAHSLALKADGSVVAWGNNTYAQALVPSNLVHVTTLTAGTFHNLVIGNRCPFATNRTVTSYPNRDLTVSLRGIDLDGDPLSFRISSLPSRGTLYQYTDIGPGAPITAPDTIVNDPSNRVVFAAGTNEFGDPYTTFSYTANDGDADSPSATVTARVLLPPAPVFAGPGWNSNGSFELAFSGGTNAAYSIWTSTNLIDWARLGVATPASNGWYRFSDFDPTNPARRFYRALAP